MFERRLPYLFPGGQYSQLRELNRTGMEHDPVQSAVHELLSYVMTVLSPTDVGILEPIRLAELQQFLCRASYAFAALCVKCPFRLAFTCCFVDSNSIHNS